MLNNEEFTVEEKNLLDRLIVASVDSLTQIINVGKTANAKELAGNFAESSVTLAAQIVLARRNILNKMAQSPTTLNKKAIPEP